MKYIHILILFVIYITSFSQSTIVEDWAVQYNGPDSLYDIGVSVDANKNIYVSGTSQGFLATIKYDQNGDTLWKRVFNNFQVSRLVKMKINKTSGDVFLVGSTGYNADWVVIKYNTDGIIQWINMYDGPSGGNDFPSDMQLDNDGNVIVTGASYSFAESYNFTTIKYSSDGIQQWIVNYNNSNLGDIANAVCVDKQNNIIITGTSGTSSMTVKYSSTGIQLWEYKTLQAKNVDIEVNENNIIYLVSAGNDGYTKVYGIDEIGKLLWSQNFDALNNHTYNLPFKVELDNYGNAIIVGYVEGLLTNYSIVKYSETGTEYWRDVKEGIADKYIDIAVNGNNDIYVSTTMKDSDTGVNVYYIGKYAPDGYFELADTHKEQMNSYAMSIAIDFNDNIYITGYTDNQQTQYDYLTVKWKEESIFDLVENIDNILYFKTEEDYWKVYNALDYAVLKSNNEFVPLQIFENKLHFDSFREKLDGLEQMYALEEYIEIDDGYTCCSDVFNTLFNEKNQISIEGTFHFNPNKCNYYEIESKAILDSLSEIFDDGIISPNEIVSYNKFQKDTSVVYNNKDLCTFWVEFTFTKDNASRTVNFYNNSDPTCTNFYWEFGDGYTSTLENPIHTYSYDGVYTVTLHASNQYDANFISTIISIGNCSADFSFNKTYLVVDFSNQSNVPGITHFSWDFGDQVTTTIDENPHHTYSSAGSYDVKLTVTNNAGCTDVITKTVTVAEAPVECEYNKDSGWLTYFYAANYKYWYKGYITNIPTCHALGARIKHYKNGNLNSATLHTQLYGYVYYNSCTSPYERYDDKEKNVKTIWMTEGLNGRKGIKPSSVHFFFWANGYFKDLFIYE